MNRITATGGRAALLALTAGAVASGLVACATVDRPTSELARARTQVDEARQSGAREYAAVEMETATTNLQRAESAVEGGDNLEARNLAVRAALDAELAQAKMRRQQADKAAQEVRLSNQTIRQEADRARAAGSPPTVPPPPAPPATNPPATNQSGSGTGPREEME